MSDYRLIIRVKNNLLHKLMVSNGIESQLELSRATNISPGIIGAIANLKVGAFNANGEPSSATQKLCDYFGCLPEDIYPREVLHVGIPKNVVEHIVSSAEVAKYLEQKESDPAYLLENSVDPKYLETLISRLTSREAKVLRARFYEDATFETIAKDFGFTRERIRQIELKALRKIRKYIGGKSGALPLVNSGSDAAELNTVMADALKKREKVQEESDELKQKIKDANKKESSFQRGH